MVATGAPRADAASLNATWVAPTVNADGTPLVDLAGYRLYLGTAMPSCPGPSFHSLPSPTAAPSAGQTVAYRIASLVAGATYFTTITAVDGAGNESQCPTPVSAVAHADMSVTPTAAVNLGTTATGAPVDTSFTVQNPTASTVAASTSVGAPFSIVSGSSLTLAPGASQVVTVRFRSTAPGTFASNVTFSANGDTLSRAVNATAVAPAGVTLSVTKAGAGTGTVTSPAGITCGTDCAVTVPPGTVVVLKAAPASGSTFVGWSGGGCGPAISCSVTVTAGATITATFNVSPVAAPPPVPASAEIIIDNAAPGVQDPAGGRTFTGRWCLAHADRAYGSTSLRSCGRHGDTYRWTPTITAAGAYDVYVWIPTHSVRSSSMPIVVRHANGRTVRWFNGGRATGAWVLHGRYVFEAGTTGYVQTRDAHGQAAADAVRFVPASLTSASR
jgi:hypothetical protein